MDVPDVYPHPLVHLFPNKNKHALLGLSAVEQRKIPNLFQVNLENLAIWEFQQGFIQTKPRGNWEESFRKILAKMFSAKTNDKNWMFKKIGHFLTDFGRKIPDFYISYR